MAKERLHKILAHAGIASRRACEEIITSGRVMIDGQVVTELGTKADPATQDIRLDGRRIKPEKPEYWLLNKPKGVVCTNLDPTGRTRPIDLMQPYSRARLFAVGRLDVESMGLLIMTNDGEFANLLTHPRYEVPKTYLATIQGRITGDDVHRLIGGIHLAEGRTRPAHVTVLKKGNTRSLLEITIREGRNRQIRRMLAQLRHAVRDLVRTRIGHIILRGIGPGRARPLDEHEVEYLRRLATQPPEWHRPQPAEGEGERQERPPRGQVPAREKRPDRERFPRQEGGPRREEGSPRDRQGAERFGGGEQGRREGPPSRGRFRGREKRPGRERFPLQEGGPRREEPPSRDRQGAERFGGREQGRREGPPRRDRFRGGEGRPGRDRPGAKRFEDRGPRREGPPGRRDRFHGHEGPPRGEGRPSGERRGARRFDDRGPRREGPPGRGRFRGGEGRARGEGHPSRERPGAKRFDDRGPRREGPPGRGRFRGGEGGPRREGPPRGDRREGRAGPGADAPRGPQGRRDRQRGSKPRRDADDRRRDKP